MQMIRNLDMIFEEKVETDMYNSIKSSLGRKVSPMLCVASIY